jgi:hypothetical protein
MEIVLNGVTASALSTVAGTNFIPDLSAGQTSHAAAAALLTQSIAAAFAPASSQGAESNNDQAGRSVHEQAYLAPPHS